MTSSTYNHNFHAVAPKAGLYWSSDKSGEVEE